MRTENVVICVNIASISFDFIVESFQ